MTNSRSPNSSRYDRKTLRLWPILVAMLALVGVTIGILYWLKSEIQTTTYTTDTTERLFILGNDVVNLPLNIMRFEKQRRAEVLERADLVILWPNGSGYTTENASKFDTIAQAENLIFVTLLARESQFDMDGRLEPVYMKLFDGPSTAGPAQLRMQKLIEGSGYDREVLAIYPGGADGVWISRCQIEQKDIRTTCLRDRFVGKGLSLRFRFSTKLLSQWRQIEALVEKAIISKIRN